MNQEEILGFSMNNALEMILVFQADGIITYVNNKARILLDFDESDVRKKSISDVFLLSDDMEKIDEHKNVNDFDESVEYDLMAYRSNMTCFPVKARVMRCPGEEDLYICMALDVTQSIFLEKKIDQIEKAAEDAMKVKSEFVANVTHELRTPVNGFLGNTRELFSRENDPDKIKILKMLERGCNDMNSIINNILDFSKLEAGKFTIEKRMFDFREMIDYVKANHNNKITEKGLDFFVTISPDIPNHIIGDELRIVQVLNNLLSNACKFTSVGKIVLEVVKTMQVKNRIELFFLVIDSGIGISKDDQDKLFKSFSQVDASITRKFGGTGLGLNICKQLVELMDGSIHVESEPNKGSMFTFSVWVEVPQEEADGDIHEQKSIVVPVAMESFQNDTQYLLEYGKPENMIELHKKMEKLILAVEMDNWEKSEMFLNAIKQLTDSAPREVKTAVLKLKMAVQKGDYDKTTAAYDALCQIISESEVSEYE